MSEPHRGAPGYVDAARMPRGNARRSAASNSVSLVNSSFPFEEHRRPPALIHGANSSTSEDIRMGNTASVADSGIENVGVGKGTVTLGERTYPFHSSNGSGESSGSELRALQQGNSSGSRRTRQSTAEDWFESFNKDVRGNYFPNFDDELPYHVPRQQAGKHRVSRSRRAVNEPRRTVASSSKFGGGRGQLCGVLDSTEESNSDSFRSVIDDLTVKNKKLKRRLRKLEGLRSGNKQYGDKVLEVWMHGLSDNKKQELEELLQRFVSNLGQGDVENTPQRMSSGSGESGTSLAQDIATSTHPGVDSGYATMSRSGSASVAPSNRPSGDILRKDLEPHVLARSRPHSDPEIAKMMEVVRRLEQLFTGREATKTAESSPSERHQQDISDIAKADDRAALIRAGQRIQDFEGTREASMMSPDSSRKISNSSEEIMISLSQPHAVMQNYTLDQRPTRPRDLDPMRKQVAEENVEYLTHLTETSAKGCSIPEGWVYLNLITNLAQLHTINVTTSFVRKAISTVSSRLELSPDGQMVRWKGGDRSDTSRSGCSAEDTPNGEQAEDGRRENPETDSSREKFGPDGSSSGRISSDQYPGSRSVPMEDKFHYKPLFARSSSFDDDSASVITDSSTPPSDENGSNGVRHKKDPLGPVVYFKGQQYYTDLSRQVLRADDLHYESPCPYEKFTNNPIGCSQSPDASCSETKSESPLCAADHLPANDQEDMETNDRCDLVKFSPSFEQSLSDTPRTPIELEASGIGGVSPADNFVINVETKHYLFPDGTQHRVSYLRSVIPKTRLHKKITHSIPKIAINAFHEPDEEEEGNEADDVSPTNFGNAKVTKRKRQPCTYELYSEKTLELPPSALPPASYILAPGSTTSSSTDTDDDYIPRSSGSEGYLAMVPEYSYRQSSGEDDVGSMLPEENNLAASSVATAGDLPAEKDWDDDDAPFSFDDDEEEDDDDDENISGSGWKEANEDGAGVILEDRPNLKRSRSSGCSLSSVHNARKSQRMTASPEF